MKTVLEQALEALEATLSILYEDMNMAGGPDEYAAVRTVILQTNDAIAALKEAIAKQGEPVATVEELDETDVFDQPQFKVTLLHRKGITNGTKLYTSATTKGQP
jgi:hypothetical protein